ncbi:ABC transporter substrate-binding protein [uncultured Oscillibacter sp.]|uniref:ABC transporter substrate-binding protein n=1 Tax=uncultured Oscillibacter sp. TaxID=876091 RepID=UPI0025F9E65F|nr:ABC transporter substrate-binding protein [uncultured Oscillibacter sp.]
MKKFLTFALAAAMTLSLAACGNRGASSSAAGSSAPAKEPFKIGLLQYGQHGSLDNCREGFLEGLTEAGLVENVDYTVDYQNGGFDDNVNTQIAGKFSADNVDMMVGVATPSAMACYAAAEEKDIPVIFVAVTDPAAAGLASGNVTGTSDLLPVSEQLQLIRALQPDAKTIGILYTTSEPNSVSAVAEYEAKAGDYGFTIDAVGVTAQAEVPQAADTLLSRKVDCFSNLTDNNVVGVLAAILEKTNEAGVPVYGSEIEQVKLGCVAAAGIDYVQLGRQTGAMAAKVIRGEAACADIPFETIASYSTYVNSDALDGMGITLPADIAQSAVEVDTAA